MLPRAHPARAVAAGVLLLLLLAGCSAGASDERAGTAPSPSGSPVPGASAAPTATVETPPAAPKARRGPAGQKVFARHVMALWAYALRTNNTRPLTALGPGRKPCGGCRPLTTTLRKRAGQGWMVDFPGLAVRSISVRKAGGKVVVAKAEVDVPKSDSYNTDGSYRNTSPAHRGSTFEVRMRLVGGSYELVSFTLT